MVNSHCIYLGKLRGGVICTAAGGRHAWLKVKGNIAQITAREQRNYSELIYDMITIHHTVIMYRRCIVNYASCC